MTRIWHAEAVGILGKKTKIQLTDRDYVLSTSVTLAHGLLGCIANDIISAEDADKYWAVIFASADRHLKVQDDKALVRRIIRSQIMNSDVVRGIDSQAVVRGMDAYSEVEYFDALYFELDQKSINNGNAVIDSMQEIIVQVFTTMPPNVRMTTHELSVPMFAHYIQQASENAMCETNEPKEFVMFMSMSFALAVDDLARDTKTNPVLISNGRLNIMKSMLGISIAIWAFRLFNVHHKGSDKLNNPQVN